jgi:2-methylisocitrate lyase-like PEP mutase family enzyme
MKEKMTTRFRALLKEPGVIVMPGVYDGLSAKTAEKVGFNIVTSSGGSICASLGLPDLGIVSLGEMRDRIAQITRAISIPVFVDADTGYGVPINVHRTVKEFIWAGAAGLFIEDQQWPKRFGHLAGKQLISREELTAKVRAALDARNEEDPDFVLCIRTDAVGSEGFEEAIQRAKICSDLGVDLFLIEPYETLDQMKRATKEVDIPLILPLVEGGKTPLISVNEAEEMGFKLVAFPGTAMFASAKAVKDVLRLMKQTGSAQSYLDKVERLLDFFDDYTGLPEGLELERKYR